MDENQAPIYHESQGYPPIAPPNGYFNPDPKYIEKLSVKNWGNRIGFTIFAFFATQLLPAEILQAFDLKSLYTESELAGQCIGILFYFMSAFIPFLILAFILRKQNIEFMPLGKTKPSVFAPLVFIGMAAFIIGDIATGYFKTIMYYLGIMMDSPSSDDVTTVSGLLLSIVASAIIPALVEEFSARGVVLQSLRRFGDGFAIVISAFIFAIMHGNLAALPFTFIGGLAFGYIAVRTGSLWTGITIHFLNNLMAVLMGFFAQSLTEHENEILSCAVFFLLLFAGVAALIFMLKKQPEFFRLNNIPSLCTFKEKITAFLCTPGMISTLVIFAVFSSLYLEVRWLNG